MYDKSTSYAHNNVSKHNVCNTSPGRLLPEKKEQKSLYLNRFGVPQKPDKPRHHCTVMRFLY